MSPVAPSPDLLRLARAVADEMRRKDQAKEAYDRIGSDYSKRRRR
jgi:hypothetical protein